MFFFISQNKNIELIIIYNILIKMFLLKNFALKKKYYDANYFFISFFYSEKDFNINRIIKFQILIINLSEYFL